MPTVTEHNKPFLSGHNLVNISELTPSLRGRNHPVVGNHFTRCPTDVQVSLWLVLLVFFAFSDFPDACFGPMLRSQSMYSLYVGRTGCAYCPGSACSVTIVPGEFVADCTCFDKCLARRNVF